MKINKTAVKYIGMMAARNAVFAGTATIAWGIWTVNVFKKGAK